VTVRADDLALRDFFEQGCPTTIDLNGDSEGLLPSDVIEVHALGRKPPLAIRTRPIFESVEKCAVLQIVPFLSRFCTETKDAILFRVFLPPCPDVLR
jgi:hypothetical protein